MYWSIIETLLKNSLLSIKRSQLKEMELDWWNNIGLRSHCIMYMNMILGWSISNLDSWQIQIWSLFILSPSSLVWPLAQVWTHYKIGKLNMWTLFCNVCINFWTAKYERKSCLNWMILSLQVLSHSQLIFPSKTWFFGIYLNFQWQKSLKNQYLHILNPNLTK